MCGLAGIFTGTGGPPDTAELVRMSDALAHRGPDGEGIWLSDDRRCGFAHRRLAILDIDKRSDQPIRSADGALSLVFNGEIFNFLEVRSVLASKGHVFRTEGDSEVILAAWREWGPEMLGRFNGMWAIALYDNTRGELFLARDRFGVKPLVLSNNGSRLAFASEPRALLALPWVDGSIDDAALRRSMFDPFGIEGSERSIRRGVRKLPAGHYLICSDTGQRIVRWWSTAEHLIDPPATFDAAIAEFGDLFSNSVRVRMRSDVPIGTCLSGGFDSSSIVATMRRIAEDGSISHDRESGEWRHAFIASFPGMLNDESEQALEAADYAGIAQPVVIDCSGDDPLQHLDEVLTAIEEPFISLPTAVWKTYRAVRDHGVRVTLDGHGADEVMGGYRQEGQYLLFRAASRLGFAPGQSGVLTRSSDIMKALKLRSEGLYFLRSLTPPPRLETPFDHDQLPGHWGPLNRRLYGMFHATILPTLLRNFDRLSMAHSVEVRSPYLDWRLVQLVLSLPDAWKSDARYSKLIAREAMRGRMPEQIRAGTRKVGFGSQMPEWLNGRLGTWALELLDRPNPAFDAMVDRPRLRARIAELTGRHAWSWPQVTRVWPYLHARVLLQQH